jgi:tetrahydromethanopterin S-methyltransferase subunit A
MKDEYYPWGGEFTICDHNSNVAIVLLNLDYTPMDKVAIYGPLKTENIGIEKIVANVISNPNIRYLILVGEDIRGHRSGSSLLALAKNGIDKNNRIIKAPGAIPYIENLNKKSIERFRSQIDVINLIGKTKKDELDKLIQKYINTKTQPYGRPFIAIKIKPVGAKNIADKRALHSKVVIDYLGKVKKRGE